jgi:hypothetical protein
LLVLGENELGGAVNRGLMPFLCHMQLRRLIQANRLVLNLYSSINLALRLFAQCRGGVCR